MSAAGLDAEFVVWWRGRRRLRHTAWRKHAFHVATEQNSHVEWGKLRRPEQVLTTPARPNRYIKLGEAAADDRS